MTTSSPVRRRTCVRCFISLLASSYIIALQSMIVSFSQGHVYLQPLLGIQTLCLVGRCVVVCRIFLWNFDRRIACEEHGGGGGFFFKLFFCVGMKRTAGTIYYAAVIIISRYCHVERWARIFFFFLFSCLLFFLFIIRFGGFRCRGCGVSLCDVFPIRFGTIASIQ